MLFKLGHVLGLIPHNGHLRSPKVFGLYFMLTKHSVIVTSHQGWLHGCDLPSCTGLCAQKGLTLGLMLYSHHLEICSLNFCFVSGTHT